MHSSNLLRLIQCLVILFVFLLGPIVLAQGGPDADKPGLEDKSFVELTELRQMLEKEIPPLQVEADSLTAKLQERESLEREKAFLDKTNANITPDTPVSLKKVFKKQADEAKARLDLAEATQAKVDLLKD